MSDEARIPASEATPPPRARKRRIFVWLGAITVTMLAYFGWRWYTAPDYKSMLDRGQLLLAKREYEQALSSARQMIELAPDFTPALFLAAQAELGLKHRDSALEYLSRIPDDGSPDAVSARISAAQIYLRELYRLEPAEQQLRRALEQDPDRKDALELMVYLLGIESRSFEAIPWRLRLLSQSQKQQPQETLHLFSLSLADNALENPETIVLMEQHSPDDPGAQVAAARLRFELRQYDQSLELAKRASSRLEACGEAYARWGLCVVELGDEQKFDEWNAALTEKALEHPGVWFSRGLWAVKKNRLQVAVRCFWETLKRNPEHQKANYQLGQLLVSLDRPKDADLFLSRSHALEEYMRIAEMAHQVALPSACASAAIQAEKIGLLWEAYGWGQAAVALDPQIVAAQQLVDRLASRLTELSFKRSAEGTNPADRLDFSSYPAGADPSADPERAAMVKSGEQDSLHADGSSGGDRDAIAFEDVASRIGLDFTYLNAGDPKNGGLEKMFEVVGGGVGVLDFDADGYPDLWFAQGSDSFPPGVQTESLDRLFRLGADGQYRDVTSQAMFVENGFTQGVTVGDANSDGFADVFISNIGKNRLFINNGDATFSEVDGPFAEKDQYSVSALIADLNGDGWPDIYEVNYLAGDDLFTKVCGDNDGFVGSCLPHLFEGSPDQFYLNLGNGEFENVSRESGIDGVVGKGLGIVALRAETDRLLQLFIANDIGPNFFWINQSEKGGRPRFIEQGLIAGLALNRNGKSESSMGVAAGDYNGDGLYDLFVTNFDNETNTLYAQQDQFLFTDLTMDSHLGDKSEPYVGWGAQFLDVDLDGWPDLIVTNGHVNDLSRHGKPFRMPVQVFRNRGDGTFVELSASQLGPFFTQRLLGRGLARLDWNRDGREDAVITHLDAPAALLTNTTQNVGRYLTLELRGVQSPRDAIGTIVRLKIGERVIVRQLTAGDGNQVSNQRLLVFGLGQGHTHARADESAESEIAQLVVSWPSGETQMFERIPFGSSWICIEGMPELVRTASGGLSRK